MIKRYCLTTTLLLICCSWGFGQNCQTDQINDTFEDLPGGGAALFGDKFDCNDSWQKHLAIKEILNNFNGLLGNYNLCNTIYCPDDGYCEPIEIISDLNDDIDLELLGPDQNGKCQYKMSATNAGPDQYTFISALTCECFTDIAFVMSTGYDSGGDSLLPSNTLNHEWKMIRQAGQVVTPTSVYVIQPNTFWGPPALGSAWVSNSPQGTTSSPVGWYTYEHAFPITSVDSSLRLEIRYLVDDTGTVFVNGVPVIVHQKALQIPIETIVDDPGLFVVGTNTIRTEIWNDIGPHGFAMDIVLSGEQSSLVGLDPQNLPNPFSNIKITPNPCSSHLKIIDAPLLPSVLYSIIDISGNTLIKFKNTEVDVSALPNGLYTLWIESKRLTYSKRFIKVQ